MKILKFGGTSVGSEKAIRKVSEIVSRQEQQVVIITSAIGGVTDQLVKIGELAAKADDRYEILLSKLVTLHKELYLSLTGKHPDENFHQIILELKEISKGIELIKELTPRSFDYILSIGERLSSLIIHDFFKSMGQDIQLSDSRSIIKTDDNFGNANVNFQETNLRIKKAQKSFTKINLFPGFIASNNDSVTTTLGRGGSDYTAAILAAALDVDEFEIWTDVDGLMTADPRIVKNSKVIEHVSYEEAMELSHFGAKVIYPPSIHPALSKGIPIRIKNTFNPDHHGTLITKEWDENKELIRGISSIKSVSLVTLSGSSMVGIPRFSSRLFKALSLAKINVILITQSSSEHSISVSIDTKDAKKAELVLTDEFSESIRSKKIDPIEVENDLSILALVGSNMRNQVGVSGQMFNVLGKNGVSIKAIAQGSSERNISAVINQTDLDKALNVLHESFFQFVTRRINLFIIGTGNVGKAFIDQLAKQFSFLKKSHQLNIKIIGVANSRKMKFNEDGIKLSEWSTALDSGQTFSEQGFLDNM